MIPMIIFGVVWAVIAYLVSVDAKKLQEKVPEDRRKTLMKPDNLAGLVLFFSIIALPIYLFYARKKYKELAG